MILIASKEEKELIQRLRKLESPIKLSEELVALKKEIADLEIKKGRVEEQHAKEERELRHMIGLEKKRQEFEVKQAKEETGLKVREENLKAEKSRFEEQLKFNNERFEKMESYLKDMLKNILDRLPNVNMDITRRGR
jgi:hypothetical protein